MAKTATKTIDVDRVYSVKLTKSIRVGRAVVNPGPHTRLRGDILKTLQTNDPEAVAGFEAA